MQKNESKSDKTQERTPMSAIEQLLTKSRKIVLKVGSNVLSADDGTVNKVALRQLVGQVKELMDQGKQVIIVSSGAGICGVGAIDKWSRRNDINYKQALCAIGQVELMMAYKEFFAEYGILVGQMLLTGQDFSDDQRTLHIRNTLFTLVDEGVVPVINENDSVSVEEIKIGDNDTLAALTTSLWNADVMILLSDIDGVYDKDPKKNKTAMLLEEIHDIDILTEQIDTSGRSAFGTGGIVTKISAAKMVAKHGIPTILLNGKKPDILRNAQAGTVTGTVFFPR
jgi:glutamate 5-kinase